MNKIAQIKNRIAKIIKMAQAPVVTPDAIGRSKLTQDPNPLGIQPVSSGESGQAVTNSPSILTSPYQYGEGNPLGRVSVDTEANDNMADTGAALTIGQALVDLGRWGFRYKDRIPKPLAEHNGVTIYADSQIPPNSGLGQAVAAINRKLNGSPQTNADIAARKDFILGQLAHLAFKNQATGGAAFTTLSTINNPPTDFGREADQPVTTDYLYGLLQDSNGQSFVNNNETMEAIGNGQYRLAEKPGVNDADISFPQRLAAGAFAQALKSDMPKTFPVLGPRRGAITFNMNGDKVVGVKKGRPPLLPVAPPSASEAVQKAVLKRLGKVRKPIINGKWADLLRYGIPLFLWTRGSLNQPVGPKVVPTSTVD